MMFFFCDINVQMVFDVYIFILFLSFNVLVFVIDCLIGDICFFDVFLFFGKCVLCIISIVGILGVIQLWLGEFFYDGCGGFGCEEFVIDYGCEDKYIIVIIKV